MGGRLRRRELIPEDTPIVAIINDPKIVHGQFGRQVQGQVRVIEGEYKGTEFREWFSFSKDKETGQEYVPYGAPVHDALSMVEPNLDEVLDDDNLTDQKYEQFIKQAVNKLDDFTIQARVGVKSPKSNPEKKRNTLQPGSFGPYLDPEEGFEDLDMGKAS